MAGKDVKAGGAFVEVGLKANLNKGIKQIQAKMKSLSAGLATVGTALTAAGGAMVAPLAAAAAAFSDAGDAVEKMAARTGITAEAISELSFAAGQSGTSIESMEKGLKKMAKTITDAGDGTQASVDALAAVGIAADELQGKNPEEQFMRLLEAVGAIEDPTERAARAMDIFGKSGTEMLPMFAEGREGIAALREEARQLGHQLTTEDAASAAALNDSWGRISATMTGLTLQLGAAVAPALTAVSNIVAAFMARVVGFIKENRVLVLTLGAVGVVVTGLGTALLTLAGVATAVSVVLGALTGIASTLGAVMGAIFSPIGLVVVAALALFAAFGYVAYQAGILTEVAGWIAKVFGTLFATFNQTASGIMDALSAGQYVKAAQILWAGLKLAFYQGVDMALEAFAYLWDNAWSIASRFFQTLLDVAWKVFSSLPQLLWSALSGGAKLGDILSGAFNSGLSGAMDSRIASAKAELDRLTSAAPGGSAAASGMAAAAAAAQQQRAAPTSYAQPLLRSDQAHSAATGDDDKQMQLIAKQQLAVLEQLAGKKPITVNQARF